MAWEVVARRPIDDDPWGVVGRTKVEQPEQPGLLRNLTAQFGQGLSLGTSDELQAVAERVGNGTSYQDSLARQRREREAFQSEHPYMAAGATAVGGSLPILASLLLAPETAGAAPAATTVKVADMVRNALLGRAFPEALSTGQAVGQGVRYGVAFGGPAGYASAEPGHRGMGYAEGAVGGGLLGGAIPAGAALAAKTQRGLISLADDLTPRLQSVAESIGVNAGPSASSAVPMQRAVPASSGGGGTPPATGAELKILRALQEGGTTPEAAALALESAQNAGVPLSLLDVGGQPTLRLARGVRTLPGGGSAVIDSALEARAAGQPTRIRDAVRTGLGVTEMSGNSGAVLDSLLTKARKMSDPLYQALDVIPVSDANLIEMLQQPGAKDILMRLQKTRAAFPVNGVKAQPLFAEDGSLARTPTLADVNDINVTLNEMLSPTYQRMGGRPMEGVELLTNEGRSIAKAYQRQLNELSDNMMGGDWYSVARRTYAGPANARTHYERGLGFANPRTDLQDVVAQTTNTTGKEQGWYRQGIADSIDEKIGSLPNLGQRPNVLRAFWNNEGAQGRFSQALLPEEKAATLQKLTLENLAAQNSNYIRGGSQTADKLAEAADVAMDVGEKVATGSKTEAARMLLGKLRGAFNQQEREQIAQAITTVDPAKQQKILERLIKLRETGMLRAGKVSAVVRGLVAQTQTN